MSRHLQSQKAHFTRDGDRICATNPKGGRRTDRPTRGYARKSPLPVSAIWASGLQLFLFFSLLGSKASNCHQSAWHFSKKKKKDKK